jgi:hypothetical protein
VYINPRIAGDGCVTMPRTRQSGDDIRVHAPQQLHADQRQVMLRCRKIIVLCVTKGPEDFFAHCLECE